jgi:hypothetical protein
MANAAATPAHHDVNPFSLPRMLVSLSCLLSLVFVIVRA